MSGVGFVYGGVNMICKVQLSQSPYHQSVLIYDSKGDYCQDFHLGQENGVAKAIISHMEDLGLEKAFFDVSFTPDPTDPTGEGEFIVIGDLKKAQDW